MVHMGQAVEGVVLEVHLVHAGEEVVLVAHHRLQEAAGEVVGDGMEYHTVRVAAVVVVLRVPLRLGQVEGEGEEEQRDYHW